MKNFENVTIFNHPLVNHKIAILRDEKTSMKEFRELIEEITTLMTFECLKEDVPTEECQVTTPLETCTQYKVKDDSIVIVPILRAGLGMVNGVHTLFPSAKVGHIGLYRNEETLEPCEYYCKLPEGIDRHTDGQADQSRKADRNKADNHRWRSFCKQWTACPHRRGGPQERMDNLPS